MPRTPSGSFQIGDWQVEPEVYRITRGEQKVQLEIRMMEVLSYLAERAGAVVTRRELFDEVWATDFVSDNALTHAVAEIRKALGDDARQPSYIETIQRQGYRLIAPVRGLEAPERGDRVTCWLIHEGSTRALHDGATVIGRGTEADIVVEAPKVSRSHARIVVEGDRAVLEDLGSTNGTSVNGRRISEPHTLLHGDVIMIGRGVRTYRFACNDPDAETVASVAESAAREDD